MFGYGGKDVKSNLYLAHLHARLAAEGGLAEGFYQLGTFHELGMGVAKDPRIACDLYHIAYDQGYRGAVSRIDQFVIGPDI